MGRRRRRGRDVHGIVLLDKPAGISSNRALQKVRRIFDARKGGHTGNLDPFATGMLPICLGEATKTAAFMLDADKRYRAVARLGERTDTGDIEGDVIERTSVPSVDEDQISRVMAALTGPIEQVPPMYSALKHEGRKLYELARRGETVERPARAVTILALELVAWRPPELEFEVHCSKGTYVRVLAEDLARELGSVAHLVSLRRTAVAPFEGSMVSLERLEELADSDRLDEALLPPDAGLPDWAEVGLAPDDAARFCNGNAVAATDVAVGPVRVSDDQGRLLGLAEGREDGRIHPQRLLLMKGYEVATGGAEKPQ